MGFQLPTSTGERRISEPSTVQLLEVMDRTQTPVAGTLKKTHRFRPGTLALRFLAPNSLVAGWWQEVGWYTLQKMNPAMEHHHIK